MKGILIKSIIVFTVCVIAIALWFIPLPKSFTEMPPSPVNSISDENAVYSILLNELVITDETKLLVISNQTVWNGNELPNFNFDLDIPVKYVVIDRSKYMRSILEEERSKEDQDKPNISEFFKENPDAEYIIGLSKIDFNEKKDEATVYVELTYCPLCGYGKQVYLKKKSGIWSVKEVDILWKS